MTTYHSAQDVQSNACPETVYMERFAKGDAEAAQILTRRLTPLAFGHAYRLLGNRHDAEEVAQEAMLRLWRIAPEWRAGEARVTTWLYRVVANLSTDRLRRITRNPEMRSVGEDQDDAVSQIADERPDAYTELSQTQRVQALEVALLDLPERQRQAIVLRHLEELSNPEIAEIMQIGVEAVESLIARGRKKLNTAFAPRKEELGYEE